MHWIKRVTHLLAIQAFAWLEVLGLPGVGKQRPDGGA